LATAVGVLWVLILGPGAEPVGGAAAGSPPHAAARPSGTTTAVASSAPAAHLGTTAGLSVGGGVAEGLVGGWSPAVGMGGTLAYRRWSARLGGIWVPTKSSDFGPGRVQVGLAIARPALCGSAVVGSSRVAVGLCAQQQVGWMRGRGFDYEAANRAADHLWLAAGAAIVAGGPLARSLGWEAEAGVVRLLQQQR